jgi:hypothetical protein
VAALKASARDLQHEHVYERSQLVDALLQSPEEADSIAEMAVACTVTKTEHATLAAVCRANPELIGWARYNAAGIRVLDVTTGLEHSTA